MLERIMKGSSEAFADVGCIIIDEAHERTIICDILLGSFKKDDDRWKHILIIVTSATIDLREFSTFFNNSPTVEIEGRLFPVEITYRPVPENLNIPSEVVKLAIIIHQSCKQGVLCFLPGQEDVILAKAAFESELIKTKISNVFEAKVFTLYGKQEPEQQAEVFEKLPTGIRKIIFATDVAETSITIDGIVFVVDSGIKKELIFDPKRNISSLRINTISRSSAIQRAGRSGRTQPGQCTRLYSEENFENMNITTAPEIFRRPLSLAILTLRDMKFNPRDFDWISAPSRDAMLAAEEELRFLKAVDQENQPTELGNLISLSQQDPKLVRMIYRGCEEGFGMAAVTVASILTVSNMFFWNGSDGETKAQAKKHRQTLSDSDGDIVTMYRVFEEWLTLRNGVSSHSDSLDHQTSSELNSAPAVTEIISLDSSVDKISLEAGNDTISGVLQPTGLAKLVPREKNEKASLKKQAVEWCKKNFVNGKAVGLALSTRIELLVIFKNTTAWKLSDCQLRTPSNLELKRLIFSGYFLNTARLIQSNKSKDNQYFALHSDVLGNLDYKAAITMQKENIETSYNPPSWIIYDKILRTSSTIFITTSLIEECWVAEECQEFYELCISKCNSLSTEKVLKQVSQECLRTIFGKYCANMNALEKEFNCSLAVDIESGLLAAYCSLTKRDLAETLIDAEIYRVKNILTNQVIEEDYLGGTRVVIGYGYDVKEILFPQEYTTIYIRKLPVKCTSHNLQTFISQCLKRSKESDFIRTIEIIKHETNSSAIVKFVSKLDAKLVYENLKGEQILGERIEAIPTGLGPKRGVTQGETCRLKISWAAGFSTGKANVSFTSPSEANKFIEKIDFIFPGARVSVVHGELHSSNRTKKFISKKPQPPAISLRGLSKCRIRFDPNFDGNFDFEYKVTIVDLQLYIDEQEIFARVRPSIPKWVKVDRIIDPTMKAFYESGPVVEDRTEKLRPIQNYIPKNLEHTNFFDKNLVRAGIYVYFDDKVSLQNAYRLADYCQLGDVFSQPHRVEIEYTHTTSVHSDLHKFLQYDIDVIKAKAWKSGVNTSEYPPKNNSRFTTIKFRSCNANLIRDVQGKLEEISNCVKFMCENIELLFTCTGRNELTKLAEKTFLHLNNRTHGIWIYGRPDIQKEVAQDLQQIAVYLKSLEVFEKPFALNKKNIDLVRNENNLKKMSKICNQCQVPHFHFNGNKIFASGSKECVDKLEKVLEMNQYLFLKFPSNLASSSKDVSDCGICFCPRETSFILMSACGHVFCLNCIQPMFTQQTLALPIKCPECEIPLVVNDILKCAPQGTLRKFLEHGIFKYQEQHASDIFICPNPGCNQLLAKNFRRTGEYGGDFFFCDECVTTYCITCSKKLEKPVKSHDYESCGDIQNGRSDEVCGHVKQIHEKILNLSCPRCKTVFYDFVGCAAVTCNSCKCGFCGICLKDCGDSDQTHAHVRKCSKNPKQGDYFISDEQLNRIHREIRIQRLREYIKGIEDDQARNTVQRAIRKDLIDLGIVENDLTI